MITLNLIPEELKKAHATLHIQNVLRTNLQLILIVMTIISLVMLFGKLYLESRFDSILGDAVTSENQVLSPLEREIQARNTSLVLAKDIQKEFIPWHSLLSTLGALTPETVVIRQIQILQTDASLKILGTATNRDAFLLFKKNIETDPRFTNVVSPITNILNKNDINFSLTVTLVNELIR